MMRMDKVEPASGHCREMGIVDPDAVVVIVAGQWMAFLKLSAADALP